MTELDFKKVGPKKHELNTDNLLAVPDLTKKVLAAALEIEQLRARVAELEEEITRLLGYGDVIDRQRATIATQAEQIKSLEQLFKEAGEHIEAEHAIVVRQAEQIKVAREAWQKFMDSHEECTDFDGFTAQIVSMDDYHEAQEALAKLGGE